MSQTELTEAVRKEIFLALVEAQDQRMSVPQSRQVVAERFGITEKQVVIIEKEGSENEWPPL